MKTAQTIAEPIEAHYYSFNELRWHLAKFRGSRLPPSTLRDWLDICRIKTNDSEMYELEDLRLLIRYCFWLKRGGSSKGFQAIQLKEISNAN